MSAPLFTFKPGWIYIVKHRLQGVYELQAVTVLHDIAIFRPLDFIRASDDTPRFIALLEIEWAEPIMEVTCMTTEAGYHTALSRLQQ